MRLHIETLKEKINEKGYTISRVSDAIGIDESTFYRKLKKNGDAFTIGEVNKIFETLKLTKEEAERIFFTEELAEMREKVFLEV